MNDFKTLYQQKINEIDAYMKERLHSFSGCEGEIAEAMEYAVFNGGKRIRSILCTETARMLSGSAQKALPFAAAIEFIHAFSLVHDDLPCMDDDDMRRGKPRRRYAPWQAQLSQKVRRGAGAFGWRRTFEHRIRGYAFRVRRRRHGKN